MTTTEISLLVLLTAAVIICLCRAMYRAASTILTALSAETALDPVHQPRASTEPEPSDRQSLMCIAIAAGLLVLLWFGW
jgi:hypothetical protein